LIPNNPASAPACPISGAQVFYNPGLAKRKPADCVFYYPGAKPMKNTVPFRKYGNKSKKNSSHFYVLIVSAVLP
jgi:hypothetical protein